jgi:hypothetical protein
MALLGIVLIGIANRAVLDYRGPVTGLFLLAIHTKKVELVHDLGYFD